MPVVDDYTAILSGSSWTGNDYSTGKPAFITFSFDTVPASYLADEGNHPQAFIDSFRAYNASEKAAARAALAAWADASGVTFLEVAAGKGDIRFGSYDFSRDPLYERAAGFAYYPSTAIEETYAYRSSIGGDIFTNRAYSLSADTLLHEIGHALGFKHPFEGDPTLDDQHDNHYYTVMSYTGSYPGTLGLFDRQAVAHVYGTSSKDGTQVASWSWNASLEMLTQTGFWTDDPIFGVSVRDFINGAGGADRIGGFEGDDALWGGAGDDILFGGEGNDELSGGENDDQLQGGEGDDVLDGGAGSDSLYGGAGNDRYVLLDGDDQVVEYDGEGSSDVIATAVDYVMDYWAEVERLTTTNSTDKTSISLIGNMSKQEITGNAGANTLDDGGGAGDVLRGLGGNDIYRVGSSATTIVESAAQGTLDTVIAGVDFSLGADVYVDRLTTDDASGYSVIDLTGNALKQEIIGNAGENTLRDGGGAGDVLKGLGGNDIYRVYSSATTIVETATQGMTDAVMAAVDFALSAGVYVERLVTNGSTGTLAIDLTGNALKQEIIGNAGFNVLNDGGAGAADILRGLGGNDRYLIYNSGDIIIETSSQGVSDRVAAAVDYKLASGVYVERLNTTSSTGKAAIDLTGNALGQEIIGNAGANILHDGGAGKADTLSGLSGNDTYRVFNSGDIVIEGSSEGVADQVTAAVDYTLGKGVFVERLATNGSTGTSDLKLTGNELAQEIVGNYGDNRLEGKGGADTLRGLAGNDIFVFATTPGADNIDTIADFNVADDRFLLSDVVFTALGTGTLSFAAFRANATGLAQDASDRIVYETDTGKIFYDADGAGAAARIQFATIGANIALTNADFSVA